MAAKLQFSHLTLHACTEDIKDQLLRFYQALGFQQTRTEEQNGVWLRLSSTTAVYPAHTAEFKLHIVTEWTEEGLDIQDNAVCDRTANTVIALSVLRIQACHITITITITRRTHWTR